MTRAEFNHYLKNQPTADKLVRVKYKYSCETEWTYSNEILTFDGNKGHYVWENDWWKGQEEVEFIGCVDIESIEIPLFLFNGE